MAPLEPILRLFFEQAITILTDKEPDPETQSHHILMLLDEFHILGHMPVMSKAFTLLAGFNIRMLGVVQNLTLLDDVYDKKKRDTILSNCAHKIFFASTDPETQNYVSQLCGEHNIKAKSVSKDKGFTYGASKISVTEKNVPLIRPYEINTFGDDKEIILVEKNHPVKCKKIKYYNEKGFKPRLLPPADTPYLVVMQNKSPRFGISKPDNDIADIATKKKEKKKTSSKSLQRQGEPVIPENEGNYSSYV